MSAEDQELLQPAASVTLSSMNQDVRPVADLRGGPLQEVAATTLTMRNSDRSFMVLTSFLTDVRPGSEHLAIKLWLLFYIPFHIPP